MNRVRIGIDASRCKSGGAIKHMLNILKEYGRDSGEVIDVHVWTYRELADQLSGIPGIVCHIPKALSYSIMIQLLWQAFSLKREVRSLGCSVLFTADASSLCRFSPMVTLSQDLLAYETETFKRLPFGFRRLRIFLIRLLQNATFHHSDGVIALTEYAGKLIMESASRIKLMKVIGHGVDQEFREIYPRSWRGGGHEPVRCLYISPIAGYKYQDQVVRAICSLRDQGKDIQLVLAGGDVEGKMNELKALIKLLDPYDRGVLLLGQVSSVKVRELLAEADIFIFASGCESFGITLLEGMACGLPIACSERSSLPETLQDGGIYFNPADPESIAAAISRLIDDEAFRLRLGSRARQLSDSFTWSSSSRNTFRFIGHIAQKVYFGAS